MSWCPGHLFGGRHTHCKKCTCTRASMPVRQCNNFCPMETIANHLESWISFWLTANKKHLAESWWRCSRTERPTQSMLVWHPDWLRSPHASTYSTSNICHRVPSFLPRNRQNPRHPMVQLQLVATQTSSQLVRARDCQSRGRQFDSSKNSEDRELKSGRILATLTLKQKY